MLLSMLCCATVFAAEDLPDLPRLQQENHLLERKIKRLEAQVAAMRDELNRPDASQIGGGIGYIVGIFGVAAWVAARKKTAGDK